jgi:hypothetical protein
VQEVGSVKDGIPLPPAPKGLVGSGAEELIELGDHRIKSLVVSASPGRQKSSELQP